MAKGFSFNHLWSASSCIIAPRWWWFSIVFQAKTCRTLGPGALLEPADVIVTLQYVHVERNRITMRNTIHGNGFCGDISLVEMTESNRKQRDSTLITKKFNEFPYQCSTASIQSVIYHYIFQWWLCNILVSYSASNTNVPVLSTLKGSFPATLQPLYGMYRPEKWGLCKHSLLRENKCSGLQ